MNKKVTRKKSIIVVCHMFAGSYLNKNLGHEIINLFLDDNGKQYIYLSKDGNWSHGQNGQEYNIKCILLVQRFSGIPSVLEILGYVTTGITYIENYKQDQKRIKYFGLNVENIFKSNIDKQERCITFRTDSISFLKKPLYIAQNKEALRKLLGKSSQKENLNDLFFIKKDRVLLLDGFKTSQQLRELIPYSTDIGSIINRLKKETCFLSEKVKKPELANLSFAEIFGVENKEVYFSNALAHFFDKYQNYFLKDLFDGYTYGEKIIDIKREFKNIDIFIRTNKRIIVIENKLFSGINYNKGESQLVRYKRIVESMISKDNSTPQLSGKKILDFYVLTPNHNPLFLNTKGWILKKYSDLGAVLKTIIDANKKQRITDWQLEDFYNAICPHSESNYNYYLMKQWFYRKLLKK